MQKSWRTDADKLTFIVCAAPSAVDSTAASITAGKEDAPEFMIGDVNLFLTPSDDGDGEDEDESDAENAAGRETTRAVSSVIGEIELMIASKQHRGQGLGKEILNTFMWYILQSLDGILSEYQSANAAGTEKIAMGYLRVKIDKDNLRSIRLFESVGFRKVTEQPNYFGELELRWAIEAGSSDEVARRLGTEVRSLMFHS